MWVLVRIAGIIVGIATLLRLATTQGLVTYDPLFQEWMDRLQDLVELGFLTDLIEPLLHRFIDWLRSFGWQLPDLNDNWRPVFILSSLYLGAEARQRAGSWSYQLLNGALVLGCAFLGAALAGLSAEPGIVLGFIFAISLRSLKYAGEVFWSNRYLARSADDLWILLKYTRVLPDAIASTAIPLAALMPGMKLLVMIPVATELWYLMRPNSRPQAGEATDIIAMSDSAGIMVIVERVLLVTVLASSFLLGVADSSLWILILTAVVGFSAIARSFAGLIAVFGHTPVGALFPQDTEKFQNMASKEFRLSGYHVLYSGVDILSVILGSLFIASIFASPPIW